MGHMTPIDVGALYRDVSDTDTHGNLVRVQHIWINEDGETKIEVTSEDSDGKERRIVAADTFITTIDVSRIRVNTDHEAWVWRDDNR